MRRRLSSLVLVLALAACASPSQTASDPAGADLTVTDGEQSKTYALSDLRARPSAEASFNDVTYTGVPLPALLADAGYDPASLTAVKAIASDGFSVSYDSSLFLRDDVLVAFAQTDGPLADDDGLLRMVVPGGEGKMNVRMLVELQVMP